MRHDALVSSLFMFVQSEWEERKLTVGPLPSLAFTLFYYTCGSMSQNDGDLQRWLGTLKEIEQRLSSSDRTIKSLRSETSSLRSLRSENHGLRSEATQRRRDLDRIRAQRDQQLSDLNEAKRKHSAQLREACLFQTRLDAKDKKLKDSQAEILEFSQEMSRRVHEASKATIEIKDVCIKPAAVACLTWLISLKCRKRSVSSKPRSYGQSKRM